MLSYHWINEMKYGLDFAATPVLEMTNGRIKVWVHPDSGRVVQIISEKGLLNMFDRSMLSLPSNEQQAIVKQQLGIDF